jgi:hypothetical protein
MSASIMYECSFGNLYECSFGNSQLQFVASSGLLQVFSLQCLIDFSYVVCSVTGTRNCSMRWTLPLQRCNILRLIWGTFPVNIKSVISRPAMSMLGWCLTLVSSLRRIPWTPRRSMIIVWTSSGSAMYVMLAYIFVMLKLCNRRWSMLCLDYVMWDYLCYG